MKTAYKLLKSITLIAIFCCVSFELTAQLTTEIYIPIGKSPGVSGKYAVMGKIESVNLKDSAVTIIQETGGKVTVKITPGCVIYLDKSKLNTRNKKGYCTDMKPGMKAEAKYKDNKAGNKFEWIKVQVE